MYYKLLLDLNLNFVRDVNSRTTVPSVGILSAPHSGQAVDEEEETDDRYDNDADEDAGEAAATICGSGCLCWRGVYDSCHKNVY